MGEPEHEHLLVGEEAAEWDKIEAGASVQRMSVRDLIKQHPDQVLRYIKQKGVSKVGEFQIQVSDQ